MLTCRLTRVGKGMDPLNQALACSVTAVSLMRPVGTCLTKPQRQHHWYWGYMEQEGKEQTWKQHSNNYDNLRGHESIVRLMKIAHDVSKESVTRLEEVVS